jgi:uncharacterized protein
VSYSLDVNVLLHAANSSSPSHEAAAAFLQRCALDPEPLCLTWGTLSGFLRLATSAAVFSSPRSPREAEELVDELLSLPQTRVITEDLDFWRVYGKVARDVNPRGKLVPDTHLAALMLQHGVRTLYTSDTDFRRFKFLRVVDPLRQK